MPDTWSAITRSDDTARVEFVLDSQLISKENVASLTASAERWRYYSIPVAELLLERMSIGADNLLPVLRGFVSTHGRYAMPGSKLAVGKILSISEKYGFQDEVARFALQEAARCTNGPLAKYIMEHVYMPQDERDGIISEALLQLPRSHNHQICEFLCGTADDGRLATKLFTQSWAQCLNSRSGDPLYFTMLVSKVEIPSATLKECWLQAFEEGHASLDSSDILWATDRFSGPDRAALVLAAARTANMPHVAQFMRSAEFQTKDADSILEEALRLDEPETLKFLLASQLPFSTRAVLEAQKLFFSCRLAESLPVSHLHADT